MYVEQQKCPNWMIWAGVNSYITVLCTLNSTKLSQKISQIRWERKWDEIYITQVWLKGTVYFSVLMHTLDEIEQNKLNWDLLVLLSRYYVFSYPDRTPETGARTQKERGCGYSRGYQRATSQDWRKAGKSQKRKTRAIYDFKKGEFSLGSGKKSRVAKISSTMTQWGVENLVEILQECYLKPCIAICISRFSMNKVRRNQLPRRSRRTCSRLLDPIKPGNSIVEASEESEVAMSQVPQTRLASTFSR